MAGAGASSWLAFPKLPSPEHWPRFLRNRARARFPGRDNQPTPAIPPKYRAHLLVALVNPALNTSLLARACWWHGARGFDFHVKVSEHGCCRSSEAGQATTVIRVATHHAPATARSYSGGAWVRTECCGLADSKFNGWAWFVARLQCHLNEVGLEHDSKHRDRYLKRKPYYVFCLPTSDD